MCDVLGEPMDWSRFELLTFDCYGTLIDWETGILEAVRPLLARRGISVDDEAVLAAFARQETRAELELSPRASRPLLYKEVLILTLAGMGRELGLPLDMEDLLALRDSLPHWPAFPDAPGALQTLRPHHRLAVLSNVDDDLFAFSQARLGVSFDWVVTAEQVGHYKPHPAHFHAILERSGLPVDRILHVAQSLHHDIRPARELGFTTVWVNRRQGRPGGATPPAQATPHLEVPDLATLVAQMGYGPPQDPGHGARRARTHG